MVTKEQAAELIRLMKQAVFSADAEDYAEPVARLLNGEGDYDLYLDCGTADETGTLTDIKE